MLSKIKMIKMKMNSLKKIQKIMTLKIQESKNQISIIVYILNKLRIKIQKKSWRKSVKEPKK